MTQRIWLVVLLVGFYVFVPLALGNNFYLYSLLIAALTIAAIATAWSLLSNLGGMMSFGHAAFFGVGAYTSALLTMQVGVPVLLSMLIAGVCTAVVAIVMLPTLRLSGPYFSLAILGYAHIFKIIATEWRSLTGGAGGLTGIPALPTFMGMDLGSNLGSYLLILTVVLLFIVAYYWLSKSYYGLALKAMHESETATRVIGVNSFWLKALMLFISAFMTGIVGAFNAHYINFLEPSYAFDSSWTLIPIIAAICGGYRSIIGPFVGAIVIYLMDQFVFKNLIPTGHQVILGMLLVGMIILRHSGLVSLIGGKKQGGAHA
ncbi:branched-chain amino acid ABC transporter permease [Paenalcaligenes sp. Me131]|uniref:branched-chain amino acid ABC transporter permease n=1 Tax=Paenalcaligenes sp. Me131 TaxID=3392636 RepID=UPI003D2CCB54